MHKTVFTVLVSFLWTTTFAPVALATPPNDLATARQQMAAHIDRFQAKGWTMENATHQRLTSVDFLAGRAGDVYLTPPTGSDAIDFRLHVQAFPAPAGVLKMGLTALDAQGRVLGRRLVRLDSAEEVKAARVRLEQTFVSLANELQAQAAHHATPLQKLWNWLEPSAYANSLPALIFQGFMLAAIGGAFVALMSDDPDANFLMVASAAVFLASGLCVLILTPPD